MIRFIQIWQFSNNFKKIIFLTAKKSHFPSPPKQIETKTDKPMLKYGNQLFSCCTDRCSAWNFQIFSKLSVFQKFIVSTEIWTKFTNTVTNGLVDNRIIKKQSTNTSYLIQSIAPRAWLDEIYLLDMRMWSPPFIIKRSQGDIPWLNLNRFIKHIEIIESIYLHYAYST